MPYLLAESVLPEDILKVWERYRSTNENLGSKIDSSNHLQILLVILGAEVESEERIKLARTGFAVNKDVNKGWNTGVKQQQYEPELHTEAIIFFGT
ncbi:hypothetical protein NQ314_003707 [Rhamnusium bicolor]|uniref:Uncharacterized protein n=1 Tax=Rhamnusium bicolor TaxID=1586634 RepID=A0AAV8ZLD3_9CUCU|nr:hypothetical protein NQ314_003707 [Rhamnusium bicolor]